MNGEKKFHVARHQEVLGTYTSSEIRAMVAKGYLQPSDLVHIEDTSSWLTIIPPLPCKRWVPTDDDDVPIFYVSSNRVFGPRCLEEMEAMYLAGYITRHTLWCTVGMEEWVEFAPIADEIDKEANKTDHLANAKDEFYQGNFLGAAIQFGSHLLNSIPDEPEEVPKSYGTPNNQS